MATTWGWMKPIPHERSAMTSPWITHADTATLVELVEAKDLAAWRMRQHESDQARIQRQGFRADPAEICWLEPPDAPPRVAAGWRREDGIGALGGLPKRLRKGNFRIEELLAETQLLGWGLGCYRFDKYRPSQHPPSHARLLLPPGANLGRLERLLSAMTLARDLVNRGAGDLTPSRLAEAAIELAERHAANCRVTVGDDLLKAGFTAIHAVGRAASDAPRLVDITWGEPEHPLIVVAGKGVCFDSGGLDLKPASGMRLMKKDMGGAAAALGLADLIMGECLPVRLRLLIPAVENAVAGNAYRPGDVLETLAGLSVEVDNTDAEGRLILCDALALGAADKPALMLDFATLTGSARSAVGAELSALFANNAALAEDLLRAGVEVDDPVWRLPLHQDYAYLLKSRIADTLNSAASPYAGAITAALFLEKFVADLPWAHFDLMAWNIRNRPGRPQGGEAMAMRAVFRYLEQRFPPTANEKRT